MVFGTNLKEAFSSLITSKQRTLLALIGIVIGIGSVIGMVSIGAIVQDQALKQFKDMGIDIISVRRESRGGDLEGLNLKDITELQQTVPSIRQVAPYLMSSTTFHSDGEPAVISLMGVTETFFPINKLRLKAGRCISRLDKNRYFCVIGADLAERFTRGGMTPVLGNRIAVGKRNLTIVGILERITEGGGIRPYGINRGVLLPLSTARRNFERPALETFLARVREGVSSSMIKQSIQAAFMSKRRINVTIQTAEEIIVAMQSQMRLFTLLLGAIGSISLIVGGIGVMNVMLISVTERRREIGIRRALGALQSDIQSQFLIESVTLCVIGGIIGILLGVVVSFLFSRANHWDFGISYISIILGFGVATAVGVFFGFYPARSAAKLDPITALRS